MRTDRFVQMLGVAIMLITVLPAARERWAEGARWWARRHPARRRVDITACEAYRLGVRDIGDVTR
jgi:hypothetical protein